MNEPDDAMIGRRLGNYTLIHLLGRGGFANVYLAENVHIQTRVAIKVLQTQIAHDEIDHFRDEARTIAELKHQHIVQLLDFGIDPESRMPYLIMSYAPNGSLRSLHRSGEIVALPVVVAYVRQIADALHFAHTRRIVHRDVKPENVLLNEQMELLLTDFGIARIMQTSRQQSIRDASGTLAYMAPEQMQGKLVAASDQYALGIMTYEWLTGVLPFRGNMAEVMAQHAGAPPPSLRVQNPTLPPALETVVVRALAKHPQERFPNVKAFADAFEQASKGYIGHVRPTGLQQPPANLTSPASFGTYSAAQIQQPVGPTQYAAMGERPGIPPTVAANIQPFQTEARPGTTTGMRNTNANVPLTAFPSMPNIAPPPPYQTTSSSQGYSIPHSSYSLPGQYVAAPVRPRRSWKPWMTIVIVLLVVFVVSCGGLLAASGPFYRLVNQSQATAGPGGVPAMLTADTNTQYLSDWSRDFNHWVAGSEWRWIQSNIVGSDGGQGETDYGTNPHDYFLVAPYHPASADYEVDAQIQYLHSASSSEGDFGIVLRSDQNGNGYFCGFNVSEGQYDIELMQYGGLGDLTMTSLTQNGSNYGSSITMDNQYHTYSARVEKNVITLFVDSKQVAQVTDNTYLSPGYIGLRSYSTVVDIHSFRAEKLS